MNVNFYYYELLAKAIKAETSKESLELLKKAGEYHGDEVFQELYFAVAMAITDRRVSER